MFRHEMDLTVRDMDAEREQHLLAARAKLLETEAMWERRKETWDKVSFCSKINK